MKKLQQIAAIYLAVVGVWGAYVLAPKDATAALVVLAAGLVGGWAYWDQYRSK